MKKVTVSVAALIIAMNSYSQCVTSPGDSVLISQESIQAESAHENLRDIVYKAEDMLAMIEQDVDSGFIYEQYAKFYQKMLSDVIKLAATTEVNGQDLDYQGKFYGNLDCENCDEID
jgi:hypothetical protein